MSVSKDEEAAPEVGGRRAARRDDRGRRREARQNAGRAKRSAAQKRTYKRGPERREQILECALGAFAERGFHQTSIADVCERAAIGRATLYQYFADKRDLLVALAEGIAERALAAHAELPPMRIPPGFKPTREQSVTFMQARLAAVLRSVFDDADTARLVLRAGRGTDGVVDEALRRVDQALLSHIEEQLRMGVEAGVIRPLDPHFVATFFLGGVEKVILSYVDDDRPLDVDAIAREAAVLEMFGIAIDDPYPEPNA